MMRVTDIRVREDEIHATLSAHVWCDEPGPNELELWLRYPREYRECLSASADPWIALLLWPAMRLGQRLVVEAAGSSKLMEAVPTLTSIMHCWDDRFNPIEVQTQGTSSQERAGATVASFFSGGVDSFYTALKHAPSSAPDGDAVTHLISIYGLDVPFSDPVLWDRVCTHLRDAAKHLGCAWVEAATNVRDVVPGSLVAWPMHYGAVLAGIALGIKGGWRKVFIPAAQTYADMYPGGSHPLLDPLWSSESVRIVNDGAEATRIQKIQWQIAKSDVALRHLRVCWENRNSEYNCGHCEKCIRTMVSLKIAGVLDQCESFDHPLSYANVSRVRFTSPAQRVLMAQNYEAAKAAGSDPALIRALSACLYPPLHWRLRRGLYRRGRRLIHGLDHLLRDGYLRGRRQNAQ
jgi:hypothetical protein